VRAVKPGFAIWFDSGVRSGSDILTAYALGADYVGVGRPVVYGAILNQRKGVALVLKQLVYELRLAAITSGLSSLNNVPPDIIKRQTFVH
jgi:isopentenyl diphosphate isomerase/L-lactate dehydrogenase-like FMN-dependent dehydrogenase